MEQYRIMATNVALRAIAKYGVNYIADTLKVTRQIVYMWKNGEKIPSGHHIMHMHDLLFEVPEETLPDAEEFA